jgi:hypothetical protein
MSTMWHPPGNHDGAMIYEGPEDSTIDQVAGNFETVTTAGSVVVNKDGVLLIILPDADPVFAGALWNDAGTVKVSTGIA